jgi:hypothetical protein
MITLEQYFRDFEHTKEQENNARILLDRVNFLLADAVKYGVITKAVISGQKYGGFRPKDCPIGASQSSHKNAMAVDIADAQNTLDAWLDDIKLLKYDLYREHPEHTYAWCHLSTKSPKSGRRTFLP